MIYSIIQNDTLWPAKCLSLKKVDSQRQQVCLSITVQNARSIMMM